MSKRLVNIVAQIYPIILLAALVENDCRLCFTRIYIYLYTRCCQLRDIAQTHGLANVRRFRSTILKIARRSDVFWRLVILEKSLLFCCIQLVVRRRTRVYLYSIINSVSCFSLYFISKFRLRQGVAIYSVTLKH